MTTEFTTESLTAAIRALARAQDLAELVIKPLIVEGEAWYTVNWPAEVIEDIQGRPRPALTINRIHPRIP